MLVDDIPIITVTLCVLCTSYPFSDVEIVCYNLIGIFRFEYVKSRQVGVFTPFRFEDFICALCSKYILHVITSSRCLMMVFSCFSIRSP